MIGVIKDVLVAVLGFSIAALVVLLLGLMVTLIMLTWFYVKNDLDEWED